MTMVLRVGSEMLKLIENELNAIRNIAEHVAENDDDGFLLYLLDMAILEIRSRARSKGVYRRKSSLQSAHANDDFRGVDPEQKVLEATASGCEFSPTDPLRN